MKKRQKKMMLKRSHLPLDASANAANAGTANNEAPRLEPEKLWPEYMKGKSVIDEMDKNR